MPVDSIGGWRMEHYQIIADVYISTHFQKESILLKQCVWSQPI